MRRSRAVRVFVTANCRKTHGARVTEAALNQFDPKVGELIRQTAGQEGVVIALECWVERQEPSDVDGNEFKVGDPVWYQISGRRDWFPAVIECRREFPNGDVGFDLTKAPEHDTLVMCSRRAHELRHRIGSDPPAE